MTHEQADILLFYLQNIDGVFRADVYDRTADATIHYKGNRETIIETFNMTEMTWISSAEHSGYGEIR